MSICTVTICDNCNRAVGISHHHIMSRYETAHLCDGCIHVAEGLLPDNQPKSVFWEAKQVWDEFTKAVLDKSKQRSFLR